MGRMFRCVSAEDGEPVDPVAWGLASGELTKNWCQSSPRLIACVDDRRVAVYAGGDLSDDASDGFGWECASKLRRRATRLLDVQLRGGRGRASLPRSTFAAAERYRRRPDGKGRRVDVRVGGDRGERRDRGGGGRGARNRRA